MLHITLPQFASYVVVSGPSKVTKVLEVQRSQVQTSQYAAVDRYIHLRAPLREALLAGGDPQPLLEVLPTLQDPKKIRSHRAVVDGLIRFFRSTRFEAAPISKQYWTHGDLRVSVTPTARLLIGDESHVLYVHLKNDELDTRTAAPVLALMEQTHGHLGTPLVVEARTGKAIHPSPSARTRRGLSALIEAEAESFVRLWHGVGEVA